MTTYGTFKLDTVDQLSSKMSALHFDQRASLVPDKDTTNPSLRSNQQLFEKIIEDTMIDEIFSPLLHLSFETDIDVRIQKVQAVAQKGGLGTISEIILPQLCLSSLPSLLLKCHYLRVLKLEDGILHKIPRFVSGFGQLACCSFAKNKLKEIPPGLLSLPFLKMLNLSFNKIAVFPPNSILGPRLSTLNLSHNQIQQFSNVGQTFLSFHEGQPIYSLTSIDLSYNQLSTFSLNPSLLFRLEEIDISHNFLKALPAQLPPRLKHFNAAYNIITSVGALVRLQHLHSLRLNNNRITELPQKPRWTHLCLLQLEHNELTKIPPTAHSVVKNLVKFSIHHNNIQALPDIVVSALNEKSCFLAVHNPFRVDFIAHLIDIITKRQIRSDLVTQVQREDECTLF